MNQYVDYYDDGETEERVQVSQAVCEKEEDIAEAIEMSKRELKRCEVPYGYTKIDEQIITTVYKIPENEIVDTNTEEISHKYASNQDYYTEQNIKSKNIYSNEEEPGTIYNYDHITKNHGYLEGKSPIKTNSYSSQYKSSKYNYNDNYYDSRNRNQKYINKDINGNKIENYFENKVSEDGEYLVSMTLSKKIMDYGDPYMGRGKYMNNYYKEEIEVDENDGENVHYGGNKPKKITKSQEQSIQFLSGNNYIKRKYNDYNY